MQGRRVRRTDLEHQRLQYGLRRLLTPGGRHELREDRLLVGAVLIHQPEAHRPLHQQERVVDLAHEPRRAEVAPAHNPLTRCAGLQPGRSGRVPDRWRRRYPTRLSVIG